MVSALGLQPNLGKITTLTIRSLANQCYEVYVMEAE